MVFCEFEMRDILMLKLAKSFKYDLIDYLTKWQDYVHSLGVGPFTF